MNKITIDCTGIESPRQLHAAFAEALALPQWYGHNLDALHDCLTALSGETEITLKRFSSLPGFSGGFRRVILDAQAENANLKITFL